MSHSTQRRFEVISDVGDDENDGSGDAERNEVIDRRGKEKQKKNYKKLVLGYRKGIKKAKRVFSFPVRKFQKLFGENRSHNSRSGSGSGSGYGSSSFNHRTEKFNSSSTRAGGGISSNNYSCFHVCLSKPQTLDSDIDGEEKNDDPESSYEFMKDLIEKNDFYSKECNTHIIDD